MLDEREQTGVRECWMADPQTSDVAVSALTQGVRELQGVFGSTELVGSSDPEGFEIPVPQKKEDARLG